SHPGEIEERVEVRGLRFQGTAASRLGLVPVAGLRQCLHELGASGAAVGGTLDRPAVLGDRIIALPESGQAVGEPLVGGRAVRSQRQGSTKVPSRLSIAG